MVRLILLFAAFGLVIGCSSSAPSPDKKDQPRAVIPPPSAVPMADRQEAAQGDAGFAVDLYGQLRGTPGNLIFSPASISTALAMTWAGARGTTADEMKKVLHVSLDPAKLHAVNHKRLYDWNGGDGTERSYELSVANSLWGQKDEPWNPEFVKLMEARYAAGLRQVDFKGATEEARSMVNKWVDGWTRGKISELVEPGAFTPDTRLALVNAIYFKGDWDHKFDKDNTKDAPFYTDGKEVKTPLMFQTHVFPYQQFRDALVVELPYKDKALSMIVVLPHARDGLAEVEKTLTPVLLADWVKRLDSQKLHVYLPRFKFNMDMQLAETLKALGMASAFDRYRADFSGMNSKTELMIDRVVHKATVETNEEGSEAAAATYAVMVPKSAPGMSGGEIIPTFRADHPFLFLIRDNKTGDILFLGRVSDPSK